MWIPTPVYERIPQFWFLLGLLFFANGLYLGLEFAASFGYIVVGLVCSTYGVGIAIMRMRYRRDPTTDQGQETEQAQETDQGQETEQAQATEQSQTSDQDQSFEHSSIGEMSLLDRAD